IRVSKLSCLNGPEPEPTKFWTHPTLLKVSQACCATGSAVNTLSAAGDAMLRTCLRVIGLTGSAKAAAAVKGIQFGSVAQPAGPQNRVRLEPVPAPGPVKSPVAGSKITPPPVVIWFPFLSIAAYSPRSQYPAFGPVVLVGVHVDKTVAVGMVNRPLMPLVCRVPW